MAFKLEGEELEAVGIVFDMIVQRGEGQGLRVRWQQTGES